MGNLKERIRSFPPPVGHYSISANNNLGGGGKGGKAEGEEDAGGRDKQGLNYFSKTKKNR